MIRPETPEQTRARLEALVAGDRLVTRNLTVGDLARRFLAHARQHYSPRAGQPNCEARNCEAALVPLVRLYGPGRADQVGPVQLRAVQLLLMEQGLAASTINHRMARIRRAFRWAVSVGLVAGETLVAFETLPPARPGQAGVPVRPPVVAADLASVHATLPYLVPPSVAAAVEFLVLTGARPGECCALRAEQIDRGRRVWRATMPQHKTAWRCCRPRVIMIGPHAQAVIEPLLRPGCPVFRNSRGAAYSTNTLSQQIRRGVQRALAAAAIREAWHVSQLRHLAATMAAERGSVTTAQHLLGHEQVGTTARYVRRHDTSEDYALRFG